MTSGPVVIQVLEGEGAIAKNRELMGATDRMRRKRRKQKLPSFLVMMKCAQELGNVYYLV